MVNKGMSFAASVHVIPDVSVIIMLGTVSIIVAIFQIYMHDHDTHWVK